MKVALKISYGLIYLVGFFFIFMAFGCFADISIQADWTITDKLICFLIQCIPGALLIFLNYFLRKKRIILGLLLIVLGIVSFFFFRMVTSEEIQWGIIFTIFVPLVTIGILFLIDGVKQKKLMA